MTDTGGAAHPPHPLVAVYADESCLGNGRDGDNPGGAGALVEYSPPGTAELVRRDLWLAEPATTNNRMALCSAIETLKALSGKGVRFRVVFTSDSRYLVDGMSDWVHGWARRGWTRKGGAIENLSLWMECVEAARQHDVNWRWVRGHRGHPQNEYANHLATRAAAEQTHSGGLVPSAFDAWLERWELTAKIPVPIAPFPAEGEFRAGIRLPAIPPDRP